MIMLLFLSGLLIGGLFGFVLMCLFAVSSREERLFEREAFHEQNTVDALLEQDPAQNLDTRKESLDERN